MTKLYKFTVIGYYEETGQTFAYEVRAEDAHHAMRLAVNGDYVDMSCADDVVVVGAIRGSVRLVAPCEDTGKIAAAVDALNAEVG